MASAKFLKDIVKWAAGQRAGRYEAVGSGDLTRNWSYRPSSADAISLLRRRRLMRNARPAPDQLTIRAPSHHDRWSIYFIYAPDGVLTPAHHFTLKRLSASASRLLVVFAGREHGVVPEAVLASADAIYWKDLPGFDFSGYAIGLAALARHSPGAQVLVMNDSVYGPFYDPDDIHAMAQWDLTGFTASGNIENHIQSYAFVLRNWTPEKMAGLKSIFPQDTCFDSYEDVVFCQESRFARVASRIMSVGSLWYTEYTSCADPSLYGARILFQHDFPFIKKSLSTKHAGINDGIFEEVLIKHDHPL